jgi:hypothetical protein
MIKYLPVTLIGLSGAFGFGSSGISYHPFCNPRRIGWRHHRENVGQVGRATSHGS